MRLTNRIIFAVVVAAAVSAYLAGQQVVDAGADRPRPSVLRGGNAWGGASPSRSKTAPAPVSAAHPAGAGAVLTDKVTRVRDGDTIVVGLIPMRIANLDCAESGTPAGDRATARVRDLVDGVQVTCRLEGRRSFEREVALCALPDGRDLGEVLIGEGECGRWR